VLARTLSIWARNFLPFGALSLLIHVPLLAYTAWLLQDTRTLVRGARTWAVVNGLGTLVMWLLVTGAVTFGTVMQLRGRPATVGASIATGIRRFFPIVGVGLLLVVYLALAIFGLGLVFGLLLVVSRSRDPSPIAGTIAGILALALVATTRWVAVPASVVEGPGTHAMRRSRDLTRGNLVRVFGVILVIFAVNWGLGRVVAAVFERDTFSLSAVRLAVGAQMALSVFVSTPLWAIASAVSYHDLRVGKEGVDAEELAKVFE
jgi:hypothetical protein